MPFRPIMVQATPMPRAEHVSASSLANLPDRVNYLKRFLQFTDADGAAIRASKPVIAPLLPAVLDSVYGKLLSYDITASPFAPHQPGYDGPGAEDGQKLSLDDPQIRFRQHFLKGYFVTLVSNDDWSDWSKFWAYLDRVGTMHTGEGGGGERERRPDLRVDFVHTNALLGFVGDMIIASVFDADGLDLATKKAVIRAFNKLLWIQNDLFARHYVREGVSDVVPKDSEKP
ncbi:MAG: hypothetical protein M1832_003262 [Thelocarpon impressellum]|nr:MAG: hypothetical protein M1832_003262 [Thelocarpon impressellum]